MKIAAAYQTWLLMLLASLLMSVVTDVSAQVMPDSVFFTDSHPVIFKVNKTDIQEQDSIWIEQTLLPRLLELGPEGVIVGRATASPEGPWHVNVRLADGRRDAAIRYLSSHGFDASRILFECIPEDYRLLAQMIRAADDPAADQVIAAIDKYGTQYAELKKHLQKLDDGRIWKHILRTYFPQLRAVRILATDKVAREYIAVPAALSPTALAVEAPAWPVPQGIIAPISLPVTPDTQQLSVRRELLSVKSNMLGWGLVIPQYGGWCPIPNVALEYFPAHGHMTYGASLDCPWWVGNTTNHKYMEVRNYQLETRYYLRNSDRSYTEGGAAYKGWYGQAYLQAGLYEIGFSAKKGWIGEALGGGLGFGYVLPFSKLEHWRLEFGAQFGYFVTQYDPFVYGKPVYHGGEIDGLYYYNTPLYRKDFIKRQHRFTWLGPTRVGITISYDLLYRRHNSKRPSFSRWEKGGEP